MSESVGPTNQDEFDGSDGFDPIGRVKAGKVSRGTFTFTRATLWRWGFPLATLAIVVGSALLALDGLRTILDSEEGQTREAVTDPTARGFEAFVEQTWSMLLITEDRTGSLVQVAVVAVTDRQNGGGTVLLVPPELEVEGCRSRPCRLDISYSEGGEDALRGAVVALLGVEFTEVALLTPPRWATLIEPVTPVAVSIRRDLVETAVDGTTVVRYPAGMVLVAADDAVRFMAFSGDTGFDDRLQREGEFWRAWLELVRNAGDPGVGLPEIDLPVVEVSRALARGPVIVQDSIWTDSSGGVVVDRSRFDQVIFEMFPFPIPPQPGQRPTVRLLNGSDDPSLDALALDAVRRAGADITVIGNFRNNHVIQTRVVYREPDMKERATELAAVLGARLIQDDMVSPVADLTVLVGKDFRLLKG